MDKKTNTTHTSLVERLQLPKDILCGYPYFFVLGDEQFYLENHKGILSYNNELLIVASTKFTIYIEGENLEIAEYTKDIIRIKGKLSSFCFK